MVLFYYYYYYKRQILPFARVLPPLPMRDGAISKKPGRIIVIIMESSEVRGRAESGLGARNEDLEKAAERFGLK